MAQLQAAITRDQDLLARHSAPLARERAQRDLATAKLAGLLPADSVLVEFVRIRDWEEREAAWAPTHRHLAFTLTRDNRVKLIDLGDAPTIDNAVEEARKAIHDSALFERDLKAYGQETDDRLASLYSHTLLPLLEAVGPRPISCSAPTANSTGFPSRPCALPAAGIWSKTTWCHTSPAGALVRAPEGSSAPKVRLLLVASPSFDDQTAVQARGDGTRALRPPFRQKFGPLPGTKQEAELIPPLITGERKVLLGNEATEAAVREARAAQVLHLATHGFFLPGACWPRRGRQR